MIHTGIEVLLEFDISLIAEAWSADDLITGFEASAPANFTY